MRIIDLLSPQGIDLNVKVSTKEQAIDKLVSLMDATGKISDVAAYKAAVKKREEEGTTAMGEGVAIPHAKTDAVKAPGWQPCWCPTAVTTTPPTENRPSCSS